MSTLVDTPALARRPQEGVLREAVDGAIAATSLMLGYLPFAIMIGVAAGLSSDPLAAWAGSLLLFAGSSQLAAFELVSDGAGVVPVITTVAFINARLSLYSLSLLPLWGSTRLRGRLLVAATVIDPTWMLAIRRGQQPGELRRRRAHYVGTAFGVALVWVTSIGIGVLLGARAQDLAVLAIALPVVMAAIVVPELRQRGGVACAAAAAATVPLTAHWPGGTDFLAAMVVGACAGLLGSRRRSTS